MFRISGDIRENLAPDASCSERRRLVDYLRRKARSVELQAARAAPMLATQLKALAASIQIEAEEIEHSASV